MPRALKMMMLSSAVLLAFSALSATAAQAEFHCSVKPCVFTLNPDGTGKTSHHVFIVKNQITGESISFTCQRLTGEGTSSSSSAEEVVAINLAYDSCTVNGSSGVKVRMNGCKYLFTDFGEVWVISCNKEKSIEIEIETGCVFSVGETLSLFGMKYHNIGSAPTREVTAEAKVSNIPVLVSGSKAKCLIDPVGTIYGEYTTGNTIATGETDGGGVMADAWWEFIT
jgi:hypothetical protein